MLLPPCNEFEVKNFEFAKTSSAQHAITGPWMACKIGEAGHGCQAVKSPVPDYQIDRPIVGQVRIGNYENHRSALLSQHGALDQITRPICRSPCQILEPRMDSES